jgi:hypothetical protein
MAILTLLSGYSSGIMTPEFIAGDKGFGYEESVFDASNPRLGISLPC